MNLNEEQLRALAGSCRIALTEEECGRLTEDLNGLLALADRLPPVTGVSAADGAVTEIGELRSDAAKPGLSRDVALANCGRTQDGFYCVPRAVGSAS